MNVPPAKTDGVPATDLAEPAPQASVVSSNWQRMGGVILVTVATVFALHRAEKFFIPLFLGILLAYTLNPLVSWLERVKIPRVVGSTLVMLSLIGAVILATAALRDQVQMILDQVPEAAGRISAMVREMSGKPNTVQKVQAAARELEQATSQAANGSPVPQKPPARIIVEQPPRFQLVDLLWTGSLGMFGLIGDAAMLLLLVFFLLLSGDTFKRKLLRVTGPSLSQKKITVNILDDIHRSIQNYMLTLLAANILLALLTWPALRIIGLDNAGAWAVAAGVLHFIPYLGPAVTALATGMAAFMQFGSVPMALLVAGTTLVLATLVGMVLFTWMSGRIGRMNSTAVFIALFFWGWLWGGWGLLLAIPIMGIVKVVSEHVEDLQPVAELLGD